MKLNEKRLAYEANWESRDRLLSKLYRRIMLVHRISLGILVVLLLIPLPLPTRYAIAIPILLVNLALFLYFRYKRDKQLKYLEDSFQRYVEDEGDE